MGRHLAPKPVKLIAGVLAASEQLLTEACESLAEVYGDVDSASSPQAWNVSDYYAGEMGVALTRQFVSFELLVDPGRLITIKHETNRLEDRWRSDGRRAVNLDPGYIGVGKLVLATTKDAGHRLYLGDGIYGEVTLRYEHGSFRPYPHTYRDYAEPSALKYFESVRARYLEQLRARE